MAEISIYIFSRSATKVTKLLFLLRKNNLTQAGVELMTEKKPFTSSVNRGCATISWKSRPITTRSDWFSFVWSGEVAV